MMAHFCKAIVLQIDAQIDAAVRQVARAYEVVRQGGILARAREQQHGHGAIAADGELASPWRR